ncbi:MAG: methylenetetrahydrofolate reductase [Actinobacteria bacterium]|nr:methylenetetrahydrofolate reductase [Actinomycetota bacterium]
MARIGELISQGPTLSYEFFPPKDEQAQRDLEKTLQRLAPTEPAFVSVTYGAGGSTRDLTHDVVRHIHRDTGLVAMPHLTCVGHTHAEVVDLLRQYKEEGIQNVLALGGDPPQDATAVSEFTYASELIELAREIGGFSVGVAAFPEVHPKSPDRESDRRHLAAKLDMADFGITQFFFETEPYFRMRDELDALGVTTPVLPGVMPLVNVAGARRMAAMNGAAFPDWLSERLDPVADDPRAVAEIGAEVAATLSEELLRGGAPGLHLYALNRSKPALRVVRAVWPPGGGQNP